MALIGKNNIRHADIPWPNPFGLKNSDAKGMIDGYPTEVITLAMIESILQDHTAKKDILRMLQENTITICFSWSATKDGVHFWNDIRDGRFDVFYKTYTSSSLKERIDEVRPLIPYYKPKRK